MAPGGELCVVHLVRIGEPVASLARFAGSYAAHEAGTEHRLAILYKGFSGDEAALAPYREALAGLEHEEAEVSDEGFDLSAYRASAGLLSASRYCFLNSHSEILADGWLAKLDAALATPGVGIAGASGSWASQGSLARYFLRLPSPYSGLFDRATIGDVMRSLEPGESGGAPAPAPSGLGRVLDGLENLPHTLRLIASFDAFPVYHLRTNGFAIRHETLDALDGFELASKFDAHRLESGRRSITRQLETAGLRAVVVDRDGDSFEREQWASSETFWQGDQGALLVADNQTRAFEQGDAARREFLSRYAWGKLASPA